MRILVVDDNDVNRKLLRVTLGAEGHEVVEAVDGVDALERLEPGKFDAVITDVLMPRMDGYRLSYEVRRSKLGRNLPILIYSSTYTSPGDERLALSVGADRFLRKPASPAMILAALTEVVQKESPRSAPKPLDSELEILKQYSERLVIKLEEKNIDLESTKDRLADALAKVRESEEEVRLLLNSTAEGIYGLDLEGRFTFCNHAALALLGYAHAADVAGRNAHALVHHTREDGTPYPLEECIGNRTLRDGRPSHATGEVLWRADGASFPVEYRSHPMRNGGQLIGCVVTFLDVTERRRAEEALRASEQRVRALMENANDAIYVVSPEAIVLEANRAAEELQGWPRSEIIGRSISDMVPPEERETVGGRFQETVSKGRLQGFQTQTLRADGKVVPIEVSASLVTVGRAHLVHAIVRDVSERRRLEEQLRLAQKMEAVGQLAGGVAHDFNNLLTAILGYADLLASQLGPDSPHLEEVQEISKAGERAAALTRQLLAFSRRQVLEPKILSVNDLVANLEKMLRRLIGEHIDLTSALDPALANVRADAGQLEQIIVNLAVNARDAMPRGGKLTIETANVELDEAYARQHVTVRPGKYVMLAVSDTGVGMDAATQARIFEPFFTTKEKGKGTGLGLSTVYGIVKQSGGYIWVYSEPGKGTTLKVYLPRVLEAVAAEEKRALEAALPRGSETVLLVEDEQSVRTLARAILESFGYTVLEASGGEEALKAARGRSGPIDLVLTDLVMPGMSGADLIQELRAAWPKTRVLFMSGYSDDAVVRHGFLEERAVFMQKPFTPQALARKVREALA